jgi:hypothetical protein
LGVKIALGAHYGGLWMSQDHDATGRSWRPFAVVVVAWKAPFVCLFVCCCHEKIRSGCQPEYLRHCYYICSLWPLAQALTLSLDTIQWDDSRSEYVLAQFGLFNKRRHACFLGRSEWRCFSNRNPCTLNSSIHLARSDRLSTTLRYPADPTLLLIN